MSQPAFEQAAARGAFAFWWSAHGHSYGIPLAVDFDIEAGRTVVCNVSRTVVGAVRARYANVVAVLVTAPREVLAARLAARDRSSDGSINEFRVGLTPAAVREYVARGHQVRALAHREDDRSKHLRKVGAEVVMGDFLDFNAMRTVLTGVRGAYFCYPIRPGLKRRRSRANAHLLDSAVRRTI